MEEKELVLKLQGLKQIRPRENWVIFTKSQILEGNLSALASKSFFEKILSTFSSFNYQNKLSYAFAALLLIVTGFVGINLAGLDFANNAPATLVKSNNDVETFKIKSQNLVEALNSNSEDITAAVKEVKVAATNLTKAIEKDPKLAKEIALELKSSGTLASLVSGSELLIAKEASDDIYKIIDAQMMEDLEKTTLTQDQQKIFDEVKELYNESKYFEALEKILLINS